MKSMKTLSVFLKYIQNTLNYSNQTSNSSNQHSITTSSTKLFSHESTSSCLRPQSNTSNSRINLPNSSKNHITSTNSLMLTHKSYICELYKIYYTLLNDDNSEMKLSKVNENLFDFLKFDIEEWMNKIRY